MTWSYDAESGAGKDQVRLLIGDTDAADVGNQIFQDEEINTFLSLRADDVFLAAASALDVMAGQEAMILKKISLLDLTTDGPAVAAALRAQATQLRSDAFDYQDFDYAEIITTAASYDQRIWNEIRRQGL